jgi:hypothetical protein
VCHFRLSSFTFPQFMLSKGKLDLFSKILFKYIIAFHLIYSNWPRIRIYVVWGQDTESWTEAVNKKYYPTQNAHEISFVVAQAFVGNAESKASGIETESDESGWAQAEEQENSLNELIFSSRGLYLARAGCHVYSAYCVALSSFSWWNNYSRVRPTPPTPPCASDEPEKVNQMA